MTDHSITPPPELVQQWCHENGDEIKTSPRWYQIVATKAAQWGADQELEACCEWLDQNTGRWDLLAELRTARRPKPPSLKELAMTALSEADQGLNESEWQQRSDTIRRALEALPE